MDRFNCPNDTNNVCIDRAKVCNGVPDCSDGFDEYNCSVCGSGLTCLLGNNIEQCISVTGYVMDRLTVLMEKMNQTALEVSH